MNNSIPGLVGFGNADHRNTGFFLVLPSSSFFLGPGAITGSRVVLLIALSSLAMGMQSVNARHFGVAGISTTYLQAALHRRS